MGKKGSAPPQAPNYKELIPIQAAEDRRTLDHTLDQMRVSQQSPYGSQYWNRGDDGKWTYTQQLSPEQQRLYDADTASKLQQSQLLQGAAGSVGDAMGKPLNTSGLPQGATALNPTWNNPAAPNAAGPTGRLGAGSINNVGPVGNAGAGGDMGRTNRVADALYGQQMRFLQPEQERSAEQLRGQLIQSGFQEGSEAFTNERNRLEQQHGLQRADARDRAILAGGAEDSRLFGQDLASSQYLQGLAGQRDTTEQNRFGANLGAAGFDRDSQNQAWDRGLAGSAAQFQQQMQAGGFNQQLRDNALREQMMLRQLPLNELNALRTGAQVQLPNNPAQYGSPQLASQDYIGAADKTYQANLNNYNASQASNNSLMGGLFGAAGAMLGGPAGGTLMTHLLGASDRRLKEDIEHIGSTTGGAPLYTFRYRGQPTKFIGVMAQDLLPSQPDAVVLQSDGYYAVDYSKVL